MKKAYLAIPLIAMVIVFAGFGIFQYQTAQVQNSRQQLIYQNSILQDKVKSLQTALSKSVISNGSQVFAGVSASAAFYVGTKDSSANQYWADEGWVPNCLSYCSGITYYKDPTTLITDEGHFFIQSLMTGVCPGSIYLTCTGNINGNPETATVTGLSFASTGAAVTDSFGGAGPCSYNGGLIYNAAFNSVSDVQGVATGTAAGSVAGGTITWTVAYTWTYTKGIAAINGGCLLSAPDYALSAAVPVYIVAEISAIGPITLAGGDTILEVWSITAT